MTEYDVRDLGNRFNRTVVAVYCKAEIYRFK